MSSKPLRIVVSVDTEEEGLWGGRFPVHENTTNNLRGLGRFQDLCEKFGFPPTYLITAPVLDDHDAVAEISRWQEESRCEVGAHCHPWCNPPIVDEDVSSEKSYLNNLPVELQHQKLQWLTNAITERIGRRPTSFRAGRYGFDLTTARCLADLDYVLDSSYLPMFTYTKEGGPDHREVDRAPIRYEWPNSSILEIPITAGFTKPGYDRRRRLWNSSREGLLRKMKVPGVLDVLDIARRIKLCPEASSGRDLCHLVSACVADGVTELVLMLHSSSLTAGCSAYCPDADSLERFYHRLSSVLQFIRNDCGAEGSTLTDAALAVASRSKRRVLGSAGLIGKWEAGNQSRLS